MNHRKQVLLMLNKNSDWAKKKGMIWTNFSYDEPNKEL